MHYQSIGPYTILYRVGAAGWRWYQSSVPYAYNQGNTDNIIQMNDPVTGSFQFTNLTNGDFVNYYLCATTSIEISKRLFLVPGQRKFTSLADAQSTNIGILDWGVMPLSEIVHIYKITYKYSSNGNSAGRAQIAGVTRLTVSGSQINIASTLIGAHSSLTGRSDLDCHPIGSITNLQLELDGKALSTHNHDSTYLKLTGGSITNELINTTSKISYGTSLTTTGLVIDSTKWYRVLSFDSSYNNNVELIIQIPNGHSSYKIRLSSGASGNGMGWTVDYDTLGIYNYAIGNIIKFRIVDFGANAPMHIDVKFNGNGTQDIKSIIPYQCGSSSGNYVTLVPFTDQGTTETGKVVDLSSWNNDAIVRVQKASLNIFGGSISTVAYSDGLFSRYMLGSLDFTVGINSTSSGIIGTRSNHPLCFWTNNTQKIVIDTAGTMYWNTDPAPCIRARFINGKSPGTNTDDDLYLNWNAAGKGVIIGDTGSDHALTVYGQGIFASLYSKSSTISFTFNPYGVGADSGVAKQDYAIYQESGAWTHPYPDLCISYHTGIKIGANKAYNGVRFYDNSFATGNGTETYLMGVGDGAQDVYFPISIRFATTTNSKINLYGNDYAIGVQGSTLYFRSESDFTFHYKGTHADGQGDPGAGGVRLMRLSTDGLHLAESNSGNNHLAWFRSYGQTGWVNGTYGGGLYMSDTTFIRNYNTKCLRIDRDWDGYYGNMLLVGSAPYISFYDNTDLHKFIIGIDLDGFYIQRCASTGEAATDWVQLARFATDGLNLINGWLRTNGATGWYSQTYGGGIYMEDSAYIRIYNSKIFRIDRGWDGMGHLFLSGSVPCVTFWDSDNTKKWFIYTDTDSMHISRCNTASENATDHVIKFRVDSNGILYSPYYAGSGLRYLGADSAGSIVVVSSDERLKCNITPLDFGLDEILQLQPIEHNWIENDEEDIGFLAHQVQKILPKLVNTRSDGMLTVNYPKLTVYLVNAIKKQQEMILSLEKKYANRI